MLDLGTSFVGSVMHDGTALAIAGKGTADPGSLFAAVSEAIRMATRSREAA